MSTFTFGRKGISPSQYSPWHTPVTVDVTEMIFITIFAIIGISYLSIVLGYRKRRSVYVAIKAVLSVTIGCLIIVENFGQEWEIGSVITRTPYRAGQEHAIKASIAVKIGLRSVNITLQAKGEKGTPLEKEVIDYNERFPWTWDQGRIGFGPYAGLFQRSFREAQRRGVPIPILWIAEYFVIDGEGIRFGRLYRTAGWYCHILLWSAFAGWIMANIFLQTVGRFAAYFLGGIGALQILTCIVWIAVHNPTPLVIPFEDGVIRIQLGRHFWMTVVCGIVCIILASILLFMDLRYPNTLSEFLGINPLDEYDEFVMQRSELDNVFRKRGNTIDMEMSDVASDPSKDDKMVLFKRRSSIKHAQKSLYRQPIPINIEDEVPKEAIYENQSVIQSPKKPPITEVKYRNEEQQEGYKPAIPKKVKRVKVVP